jgi:acetyl esterase/lipase
MLPHILRTIRPVKRRHGLFRFRLSGALLFMAVSSFAPGRFAAAPAAAAEKPTVVNVWPAEAPGGTPGASGSEEVRERKDTAGPVRLITNVTKPTITIIRPTAHANGAAMLICPGGGYSFLAWDREGENVAKWLNSNGVTGIILKYRVAPAPGKSVHMQPPAEPLQDAQRALSLVRSKASEWDIDPKRIGVIGFSAGGHLATALETGFDHRAYQPIDAVDEVSCRPDFAVIVYPGYLVADGSDKLVPAIRVRKDCPPTFIVVAANDRISSVDSVVLYQALKKAGVPVELHVYTKGGHGFGVGSGATANWTTVCADWLRNQGLLESPSGR